jgi:hypothetical protein
VIVLDEFLLDLQVVAKQISIEVSAKFFEEPIQPIPCPISIRDPEQAPQVGHPLDAEVAKIAFAYNAAVEQVACKNKAAEETVEDLGRYAPTSSVIELLPSVPEVFQQCAIDTLLRVE